jgi:class 3 adenylate cyclase
MITIRSNVTEAEKISGITSNIAAKLCNGAPPNTIVISENSYNLLKDIIECEQINTNAILRGIPLNAIYRVIEK